MNPRNPKRSPEAGKTEQIRGTPTLPGTVVSDPAGFVDVGRVRLAHGLRGDLYIAIPAGQMDWLEGLRAHGFIYLRGAGPVSAEEASEATKTSGMLIRLTIHSLKPHQQKGRQGLIAATLEVRDRTAAELFQGWNLEIPESLLVSKPGEEPFLRELLDGKVMDREGRTELGRVVGLSSNGAQDILIIRTENGEFGVPFVAPFFPEIDYQNRILRSDLPEGILEPGD
jgi:16S rRNA processing protein RimM